MGLVELKNVAVENRLSDISVNFDSGHLVGLIGPNGAGKSTMLQALSGLMAYQGSIRIENQELNQIGDQQRARIIALQPQFSEVVWALSVHDIVSMGRLPWGDSDQQVIVDAMQQADITELATRPVNELSGGERSRVWLARVLANQPRLLLADEPVANLDLRYQIDVMQILRRYANQGNTVIVALHDIGLAARYCDRICCLSRGTLVGSGSVEQVIEEYLLSEVYQCNVTVDLHQGTPIVFAEE